MYKKLIIKKTADYIKSRLYGESSGHDWWHVYRVWKTAIKIGKQECADLFVVELAALLHDIADYKLNNGNKLIGPKMAREWLAKLKVDKKIINHVCEIVKDIDFKGARINTSMRTKEGKVVQDADRLDAMGAIGIARTFAFGGNKDRLIYDPNIKPESLKHFEQFKIDSRGPTINHFYEKLLHIKKLIYTDTAKVIAEERHRFMEDYLDRFHKEWKQLK